MLKNDVIEQEGYAIQKRNRQNQSAVSFERIFEIGERLYLKN